VEKKYLSKSFNKERVPPWKCPSCTEGRLKLAGEFSIHSDAATQQCQNEEWFEPEDYHYVFTGMLHCGSCNEKVAISGDGNVEEDYDEEGNREYSTILTPKFFYPPLRIIEPNVADTLPVQVSTYLEKAFQVFWCDADSSVNRLRTVVEYLLDGLGISRTGLKDERLFLGPRIDLLVDPKHNLVKGALNSIRHMGNEGSHGSVDIQRPELLLAFSVVNYCLEQLYPKVADHTELLKFVKEVNESKGFPKKSKRRANSTDD
jgi:hypothetical protein